MTTTASPAAATACPQSTITEAQVASFLTEQATLIAVTLQNDYVAVTASATNNHGELRVEWTVYADGSHHVRGCSLDEAIVEQIRRASPHAQAQRLRIEAAGLLAKAHAIEMVHPVAKPFASDVAAEAVAEGRTLPKSTNIHE
jgi:hypothetical protein